MSYVLQRNECNAIYNFTAKLSLCIAIMLLYLQTKLQCYNLYTLYEYLRYTDVCKERPAEDVQAVREACVRWWQAAA
jgi:hypothetical protein